MLSAINRQSPESRLYCKDKVELVTAMKSAKSYKVVFLIPVVVLLVGMLVVAAHLRDSEALRYDSLRAQFEADAALRVLMRDDTVIRLQTHLRYFVAALAGSNVERRGAALEGAIGAFSSNIGSDPAGRVVHFFLATPTPDNRVVILYAYPNTELVGEDISAHPMLRDFDFSVPSRVDQISFLATRDNDLSFTEESPVLVRRRNYQFPGDTTPLISITKTNLVGMQKYIDSELRKLGPLPPLEVVQHYPETDDCFFRYYVGVGVQPCQDELPVDTLQYESERFGLSSFLRATPEYIQAYERNHPASATIESTLLSVATFTAFLIALAVRARLARAEQEVSAYQGSLDSKEALTGAMHSIVTDNLTQFAALAQQVKEAPNVAESERRYLNIALSEMSQLRLSLDAKIMEDRIERGGEQLRELAETFAAGDLAQTIEAELKRIAADEGVETRVLLDESLKGEVGGSAYWIESALLAFINVSLTFTDEGFVELSLWVETSQSGKPELLARIRDSGVEWSLQDASLDHPAVTVLKTILQGLGASIYSTAASATGSQEHVIRFERH